MSVYSKRHIPHGQDISKKHHHQDQPHAPLDYEDGGDGEDKSGIHKALRSSYAHCCVYEDGSMEENEGRGNWSGIHKKMLLG